MRILTLLLALSAAFFFSLPVSAAEAPAQPHESAEAFLDTMKFQQGRVSLPNGIATLDVPDQFH